jgi:hypothetical protein
MNVRYCSLATTLAALAAALPATAADPAWTKVDELPGGIAVEMDTATKVEEMDGVLLIDRATFRKQLPTGMMETAVSIDCKGEQIKIRGVKLTSDGKVLSDSTSNTAQYVPIHSGSAEAMYYKALCGKDVSDGGAAGQ